MPVLRNSGDVSASTAIVNDSVPLSPSRSVAVNVYDVAAWGLVGVPETVHDEAFSASPAGSLGATEHSTGALPPVTCRSMRTAAPCSRFSLPVLRNSGDVSFSTAIVNIRDADSGDERSESVTVYMYDLAPSAAVGVPASVSAESSNPTPSGGRRDNE